MSEPRPDLDLLPATDVVRLLLDAERRVVPALFEQAESIAAAVELLAERLRAGGRMIFVGAGTSGRIAAAEAAELPGTFGFDRGRVRAAVAGGSQSTDHDEDDLSIAGHDAGELAITDRDVLIAVAASGTTPYTLALARAAVEAGAHVIAVTNVVGSPLAALGTAIEVDVGPEVLRGSTRLTAGTAQKIVLNTLTTAAMTRIGRVHGDLMIDVQPANAKLRLRAAGIVAEVAGCDLQRAIDALQDCGDDARAAVVHIVLGVDPAVAKAHSARHASLRDALSAVDVSDL